MNSRSVKGAGGTADLEETVTIWKVAVMEAPHDLAGVVDATCGGIERAWYFNAAKGAVNV